MTPQPPPLAGCCIYWPSIRTTNKRFRTSWTLSGPTKQLSGPSGRSNITLKRLRKGLVCNFDVFLHCWHIFSSQIEREREREVYFFFQNGSIEYCYVFRPPTMTDSTFLIGGAFWYFEGRICPTLNTWQCVWRNPCEILPQCLWFRDSYKGRWLLMAKYSHRTLSSRLP